jgi:hypothetical protein
MDLTQRFIVGTGRCGSTLLSLMLDKHPDVVCLHEFFTGLDWGRRFQPGRVNNRELVEFLTDEQMVTTEVLARGYTTEEICYPFNTPQARRKMGDKLPWLLISMLSRLSPDPDSLFDDFVAMLGTLPEESLDTLYPEIFSWLAVRHGGQYWIERSGSSVDYLADLIAMFPKARFLHIHRDGREAALSIRAHPFYRLGVSLLMNLFPEGCTEKEMIDYALETPRPLDAVGKYWSDQVINGHNAKQQLPAEQYMEINFEQLVDNPQPQLKAICEFFELESSNEFLVAASALSKGAPPQRRNELSEPELNILNQACAPGMKLLRREH